MDRYGVFGNPIGHSKSPLIHRLFAAQTGQDLSYEALLAPLDDFAGYARAFFAEGRGGNVTVPFKEEAYRLADDVGFFAGKSTPCTTVLAPDTVPHAEVNPDRRATCRPPRIARRLCHRPQAAACRARRSRTAA